jgi:photosystem II stability/assembly factor-like uncharacterized protein
MLQTAFTSLGNIIYYQAVLRFHYYLYGGISMTNLCHYFSNRKSVPVAMVTLLALFTLQGCTPNLPDSDEAKLRFEWFEQHQALQAATPFDMPWQFVGPVRMTGRMTDVEAHVSAPETIYIASASGGVWKTTDEAATWTPIFDNYETASIGDIALAPSNPDIVWVGTGEANILRSSMAGTGIYKSTDAGETFTYMGLADTQHIARILVHPENPGIVYAASAGHEYTFSQDRGVYKTTNGGKSWKKVFFIDEQTGVIDMAMDPTEPDTLYVSTAQRLRYRWNDPKASPQAGIYKTTDGFKTFAALTNGLPDFSQGECERIGLTVCASQPNVIYAALNMCGASRGCANLYRSNDKGESWNLVENNDDIRSVFPAYAWFFGQVRVDPSDPDIVYIMGLSFKGSDDGGKTWSSLRGTHVDYHGMWINPTDSNHLLVVNDGGLMISHDKFATHDHPTNLPISQLYNAGVSMAMEKFQIYSSVQDHGAWRGEVDLTQGRNNIQRKTWEGAPGDESGRHAVDPLNPDIVYSVSRYGGGPNRTDYSSAVEGSRRRGVSVAPDFGEDTKRAQWVSPIIVSPHSNERLLYGAQFVFVTDNRGDEWKKISPDLTNFDPEKQGNIAYSIVFSIAESPLKKGLIYAGTDDGNVQVTRDEGETWKKVIAGLPEGRCISSIAASAFDEGTVYATVNGKRHDDFNCYVFKSTDYGETWVNIANNCPGSITNVVKEDPTNADILYLGTDLGAYVTTDSGESWTVLGRGLPTVYVHDFVVHTNEHVGVIATHGRGAWVIDLLPVRDAAK